MTEHQARNMLIHAATWLRSEGTLKRNIWATSGVYFALLELEKAKKTFYSNSPHRERRCLRCAEIKAVAIWNVPAEAAKEAVR